MGLVVYLAYKLFNSLFLLQFTIYQANCFATIISIVIGMIVYFIAMLLLKGVDEATLRRFPGGSKLVKIALRMHLLG